jgi:hypothetical protein
MIGTMNDQTDVELDSVREIVDVAKNYFGDQK